MLQLLRALIRHTSGGPDGIHPAANCSCPLQACIGAIHRLRKIPADQDMARVFAPHRSATGKTHKTADRQVLIQLSVNT